MLWLKAFHIIFVVTWFAGLFYLPRLFVYHAVATDLISLERFAVMERRLFTLMNVAALLAVGFGVAVLAKVPAYLELPWMQVKLALVVLLIGYHHYCGALIKRLRAGTNTRSQRWFRFFNEAPTLFLFAIVILVVVQPT